jgi:hypothetical protein
MSMLSLDVAIVPHRFILTYINSATELDVTTIEFYVWCRHPSTFITWYIIRCIMFYVWCYYSIGIVVDTLREYVQVSRSSRRQPIYLLFIGYRQHKPPFRHQVIRESIQRDYKLWHCQPLPTCRPAVVTCKVWALRCRLRMVFAEAN